MHLGAPAQQHDRVLVRQRQLLEQLARGDQRHEPLDPLVADGVAPASARELHVRHRHRLAAQRLARQRSGRLDLSRLGGEVVAPASCCGPSQIASSGCGWTSTMIPSAPTAAAASDIGITSSRRPAAWLGSTITGSWVSSFRIGHGHQVERERDSAVSNVRIPRSHRITASLPSLSTYSAAISSSSSVRRDRA